MFSKELFILLHEGLDITFILTRTALGNTKLYFTVFLHLLPLIAEIEINIFILYSIIPKNNPENYRNSAGIYW